ncbi:hypothetical protein ACWZHB_27625 [Nocardia sp. FBN12]|uniref:hypothetical protein n=1 Tax=Nocardia sp. FBN12 TaxID=3419766 RepID=UPI003CFED91C
MTVVHLRHADPGLLVIAPDGAPLVTDAAPGLDALVLEVAGGHLTWSLFDSGVVPAAVLDDVDAAQDWVWAVYGEEVAVAVADYDPRALTASPAQPETVANMRRLAYAHWASRWWPASTVDGIPALDPRLLLEEIEVLTEQCEMMFGSDDFGPLERGLESESVSRVRAVDYALAAGGTDAADGLIVARGSGHWDWRRCPPGLLDAGENAVSWQVTRAGGVSTVRVSVVAAPDCRRAVPEHLRPLARVRSVRAQPPAATEQGQSAGHDRAEPSVDVQIPLHLRGDAWTGAAEIALRTETSLDITVFVPGFGPADPVEEAVVRDRIRRFARLRLSDPTGRPLTAESTAAEADEDF